MLLGAVGVREGDTHPRPAMPGAHEGPGRRPEPAAVVGSTCSAGLSTGGISAWRGLFHLGAAQAALAHVAGESPLCILGCRGEAQGLGGGQAASQHPQPRECRHLRQGVMLPSTLPAAQRQPCVPPAPCPSSPVPPPQPLSPLPSASCTLRHELPPAPPRGSPLLWCWGWARGSRCSRVLAGARAGPQGGGEALGLC